jgi:MFS family permease
MVYPTLLAAIGDVAHPTWRARSVGVYRLWRDSGFAVGAILAGVLADGFGVTAAIWAVAGLTAFSGAVVAVRMYETHPRDRRGSTEPHRTQSPHRVPTQPSGEHPSTAAGAVATVGDQTQARAIGPRPEEIPWPPTTRS